MGRFGNADEGCDSRAIGGRPTDRGAKVDPTHRDWCWYEKCFRIEKRGFCRGVAQPGSAPALGAGGRWFKSNRPDHLPSPVDRVLLALRSGFQNLP